LIGAIASLRLARFTYTL